MSRRDPKLEWTVNDQRSADSRDSRPIRPPLPGSHLLSGFLGTAKAVLLRPGAFFPSMPVEGGLAAPHLFFLLCTSVFLLASVGLNVAGAEELDPRILLLVLVVPVLPFVDAAFLYLLAVKVLGGHGSYEGTFRVVCYASAVNLVTWVPLVGLLAQLYEIYLAALGLSAVHRIGMGRAFIAVGCTATGFLALALLLMVSIGP